MIQNLSLLSRNNSYGPICIDDEFLPRLFPGWKHISVQLILPASLRDGNATIREYGILAGLLVYQAAKSRETDTSFTVLEIGTFDGLGTLQLAINAPEYGKVFTVDLPEKIYPSLCEYSKLDLNLNYIGVVPIGERYKMHAGATLKVEQILEDSAMLHAKCLYQPASMDFVFIDGCHAYEYCQNDTQLAVELLRPGGILVWHDYMHPFWPGVARCINEFAATGKKVYWLGGDQRRLADENSTTLAFWLKPT